MSLTDELTTLYARQGNPRALIGEFRRTEVLTPVHDDSVISSPASLATD
ncbi:hypothetical protein [Streptomyces orinoci]|uniref:Uncharacterized protein n=1 Tax=Streptomyces orinoci TaxID=67339 RepID=A0ABV3JVH8_STRON|nr:hypothetical protein [Streptomyces orinoci]